MKKQCIRFIEWLRDTGRSLGRTGRNHDPLLVNSMASFNFEAVGGNPFSKPLQNTWPRNQPSLSSTSRSAYEIIHRSESGSRRGNSLCGIEHRRYRTGAERTRNRRVEPEEPPSL